MDSLGLLSELVALDTVSGEAAPQRRAMDSIVSLVLSRAPQAKVESDLTGNHPWALITNEAAPSAARLLFACHVDTVPVGTVSDWEFDPYAAQVDGELFLGRGTSDMKAGLVAATAAVADAFERGVPVALLLTSDEEIGSLGAVRSADAVANLEVGAVIVPEATGNRINLGHRGALWLEVSVKGKAAHGSTPQRGTNAVLKLLDVVDRARRELPLSSDAFLGAETWNLGLVGGGFGSEHRAGQCTCGDRSPHGGRTAPTCSRGGEPNQKSTRWRRRFIWEVCVPTRRTRGWPPCLSLLQPNRFRTSPMLRYWPPPPLVLPS